jgi:predicted  nucleic acid-binding Zn-ribbon protein
MAYRIYGVAAALMLSIGAALAESAAESSAEAAREALKEMHGEVQTAERALNDRRMDVLRANEDAAELYEEIVKTRMRLREMEEELNRILEEDEQYRALREEREAAQDRFEKAVREYKR